MNNIIQTIRHTARTAAVLLIALLAAQTAGAQMSVDVSKTDDLAWAFGPQGVSEINVTDDITGVGDLDLKHNLTINLNGHTISGDELHFNVGTGFSLTIYGEGDGGSVGNIISGYAIGPAIDNNGTVTLRNVNITTNYYCAIGGVGMLYIGNTVSFNGWTQAPFSPQNVNTEDGNYNYAPGNPFANVVATVTVGGTPHYFENSGAALAYIVSHPDNDHFSLSGTTYTIHTATGWDAFCYLLADNDKGFFDGKTVQLGANIGTADAPVTRMAGASGKDFTGTFDGDGHTLTVDYDATENYAAPFRNAENGCVVENLHVAGTIATSAQYAAGIIGNQFGTVTIRNCRVSVTISSSKSGDGTHGGLVAVKGNNNSAHLTIEGCVFDGKIVSTGTGDDATTDCGGFVGWRKDKGSLTITNCLYAPTADDNAVTVGATFARNGGSINNCYYTRTLGDAQGKALHSVTAGDDVTLALSGTATEYTVSGITAYEGNQGIKYGTTYYAGSGDVVSLSNSLPAAPAGYSYYTASAGTISGSTLTMPDQDVTVSLNTVLRSTGEPVIVSYVNARGTARTDLAIALDGTESYLGSYDQETWYFVGLPTVAFDHTLYLNGNVQLILADGCTMNVTSSNGNGIDVDGSLTIYGQTDGTGTLNATSKYNAGIFTGSGTITISGGRVTATGSHGLGICTDIGTITISGGRVTATGAPGIYTDRGTITLGCTTASDFIYASSYDAGPEGSLNIADGQTLFDEDGNRYRGNGVNIPAGKTLRLSPGIALAARQAPDGNFWTTYYNSFQDFTIEGNACAYTATYGDGKLTLHNLGKQIPAGTAVIIVADNDEVSMATAIDLDDFTGDNNLSGVNTDTPTSALGTGTFYVLGMTTVGDDEHFGFHRYTGSTMAAHKAYVLVSNGQVLARSLTMVFDEATGISDATRLNNKEEIKNNNWFTLDGRRLQAKPTAPGIYINNGKKVVIK